ncbi:MAG TPA: hypothetical protein DCQ28_09480 [Bacteroidetes bacterium]|nr:hypothetical protein [Bacteroidota bacterium]
MGSQTILDLIASTMVFGSLLLIVLRINMGNSENMQMFQGDLLVQQNLVEITRLLEYDFKKIGYCKDPTKIPNPSLAIRYADSVKIKFLTDFPTSANPQGDGILDSLTYYVGPTSEALATPNLNDRLLYRVENNSTPIGVNLGVTQFELKYFDAFRDSIPSPVTNCGLIQYMQITIEVQNLVANDTLIVNKATSDRPYQSAFWRQVRLVAKNLKNR